ncbi:src-like-adapter isoform X2 [Pan troglodytes]|uniref:src-like-adapter isoform X2 n=1 Tax=Pan troglodytes TaxID=9598 RepID=UPI000511C04B
MLSKLGHSPLGGLRARLTFPVCLLYHRLWASSAAPGKKKEMGNSMKSTPAPAERPLPNPEGLDSDFLAVLSDYPSPDISPPIFRRGEKLRVISDEGGWWKAISLSTGRESYIPGICVARVYHGWLFEGLGRDKAEELLQLPDTKVGSFMIRESETKKGFYSLSVRHRQVKHYRIFRLPNNWYYISPRLTFQCLEDLVNHYSGHLCGWTFEFTVEVGLKTMKRGLPACPPCDGLSVLLPLQIPFVLWQGCPREHSINPMGSGACQRCDVPSKTWWWIGSEARGGLVLPEASGTSPP